MSRSFVRLSIIASLAILLVLIVILLYFFSALKKGGGPEKPVFRQHITYKIRVDTMKVVYGKVGKNQHFSMLLSGRIPAGLIDRAARETRDVFDVARLRAGNKIAWITSRDSVPRTLYFIYEINDIEFVVYDFRDSLKVYRDKKKVTRLTRSASGTISSSLWNCFVENKLDLNLAMNLSDVFAWTVDFYGLQKGDGFKVIYDELFVDNSPAGVDRIHAAVFRSGGRDFYGFYFTEGNTEGYFDENGNSLRRSFLKAPLKFSRISSRYTSSRRHPILRISRPHYGVDYAAPRGTPVVALGDGRITDMSWHGGYGRFISIRHNPVYTTTYAHLSGYAKGLRTGTQVKQGDLIGYVGSSGLSTGPHLDFRVYKNGSPTNPLKLESPTSDPVKKQNLEKFRMMITPLKQKLDLIRQNTGSP